MKQPSSERSGPDELAVEDEADKPDLLTKDEIKRLSRRRSSALESGVSDQPPAAAEAKETSTDTAQEPQQELIDPNDVQKALKAFVLENNKHRVRQV